MHFEHRLVKLERSANCYRLGCILLALTLLLRLSLGAEPAPKMNTFDTVVCKTLMIVDDKNQPIAELMQSAQKDGACLNLGDVDSKYRVEIASRTDSAAMSLGTIKSDNHIQMEVTATRSILAETVAGIQAVNLAANKTGGYILVKDSSGNSTAMTGEKVGKAELGR